MSQIRLFQALVIASVVLHLAWLVLPTPTPPIGAEDALRWQGYGGTAFLQHPFVYFGAVAGKVAAAIGLLLFRPWGRWLLVAVLMASLAQLPFNGIGVALPQESVVGALTGIVDGAVVALAFVLRESSGATKEVER